MTILDVLMCTPQVQSNVKLYLCYLTWALMPFKGFRACTPHVCNVRDQLCRSDGVQLTLKFRDISFIRPPCFFYI